jgi:hypothetical protein
MTSESLRLTGLVLLPIGGVLFFLCALLAAYTKGRHDEQRAQQAAALKEEQS